MADVHNLDAERRKRKGPDTNHRAWSPVLGVVRWQLKVRHINTVVTGHMDARTARAIGEMYLEAARKAEGQ